MDRDISDAIARFPDRKAAIEDLARKSDSFRSLCSDLAEAQSAADHWAGASSPARAARLAEYRDLVHDLTVELKAMLDDRH